MEGLFILLGLTVPLGLFIGWVLGIAGWRQAKALRAEVAALRAALQQAGIAVPEAPAAFAPAPGWPPPPRPPESEEAPAATAPATAPSPAASAPAAPNPWGPPPQPAEAAEPALARTAAGPPDAPDIPATPPRPGLEEALTLRWIPWLGAAALLLAGVFLVRYAVEEGYLGPAARCVLAALLGIALIVAAEWLRRRPAPPAEGDDPRPGIPWPDQAPPALAAGGVAVLFGAAYGAAVLYALVPPLAGFVLLALAAMAGIALALLQGPLVAAIGIAGAYATPLLVQTEAPSLPGLYAYLLAVTAAALLVLRQVGAAWLGWAATIAAAAWVLAGGVLAERPGDLWPPALFAAAAAALQIGLLPGAALETTIGRRLAWIPFALLAAALLVLLPEAREPLAPAAGLLLLTPIAVWTGVRERRLDRLPWLAALAGLLALLAFPLGAWVPAGEAVTIGGVVQGMLPGDSPWPPAALRPFLGLALLLAAMHLLAGAWQEARAPRRLRWAAIAAVVPVLVLLLAYARVRGFALDARWALAAALLAALHVGLAARARRTPALLRAGAHAAAAVAALALGCAMVLADQWLTLAVALFLPPLAWVEARSRLRPLRWVALAVASVVLVRLLLNPAVLSYDLGPGWRVLSGGLLLAYGVPALCFALAARMFRRRADDGAVAVLEAGAIAFLTALVMLQVRRGFAPPAGPDGAMSLVLGWSFAEGAAQVLALAVLATLLRLANRTGGGPAGDERRAVTGVAWRLQHGAAVLGGAILVLSSPAMVAAPPLLPWPVANELLVAYALPALLAALAARSPEGGRPPGLRGLLAGYALVAAFAWVTLEVRHAFQPEAMLLDLAPPEGAELYAYSFAWLGFGAALMALAVRQHARAPRLAALAVLAATVLKAFLVDMAALVGLWRVLSFLGLGLALIALGWVYRRFVVVAPAGAGALPTPPGPASRG